MSGMRMIKLAVEEEGFKLAYGEGKQVTTLKDK
jgi:hypothetical protein